MLNQNYIKIFENQAGAVTIVYAASEDDNTEISDVQVISISKDDLHVIGRALNDLGDAIYTEG